MSKEIEIEFKVLIDKQTYELMFHNLQCSTSKLYTQINYYLSHPILDKNKFMLRIREKNDTYELTLKLPNDVGLIEHNIMINHEIKDLILNQKQVNNDIFDILIQYDINPMDLVCKYSLKTTRLDTLLPLGTLSLDCNEYLDIVDYELEYEVLDIVEGKKDFLEILKPYNIEYISNCDSKIKRLKQHLV